MIKSKRAKRSSAASFYSRIKDYKRILRSGGSFAGGVTIYGNDENLVIVTMDGIGESVKYIELKNIRAVLIKHLAMAPRAAVLAVVLSIVLVLIYFGFGAFSSVFMITSLILIFFFLLLFLGMKNCSLRIVTDVNDHLISSVHSHRVAKKLLDFVAECMNPYLVETIEKVEVVESSEGAESGGAFDVDEMSAAPPTAVAEEEPFQ